MRPREKEIRRLCHLPLQETCCRPYDRIYDVAAKLVGLNPRGAINTSLHLARNLPLDFQSWGEDGPSDGQYTIGRGLLVCANKAISRAKPPSLP